MPETSLQSAIDEIRAGLLGGEVIPYLGPGVLELAGAANPYPGSPEVLVAKLTANVSVPHKIRNNLTAAAQYIENFKHRKTLTAGMRGAFGTAGEPTALHAYLAGLPDLPLLVNAWYDPLPQLALAGRSDWGMVQGVTQSEHFGEWVHYFRPDGSRVPGVPFENDGSGAKAPAEAPDETLGWTTLLYEPLGSATPADNFIVSDSDYVEVLTEIDIQTPIPAAVKSIRTGRHFLFLGCRFSTQTERAFAWQIMKRSSDKHWAVLPPTLTKNERKFLELYGIEPLHVPLGAFVDALITGAPVETGAPVAAVA